MARSKGDHFSTADLNKIAAAFEAKRPAKLVALQIGSTARSVHRWYARFRGHVPVRRPTIKKPTLTVPRKPPVDRGPRFYKGSFEL